MENENIQVVLRVRPQNFVEVENNDREVWQLTNPFSVSLNPDTLNELLKAKKIGFGHRTDFAFDYCFDKYKTNVQIYENLVKRIALSSLQGINGTVFMYGQTGSGKTFTMVGPHDTPAYFSPQVHKTEMSTPRTMTQTDLSYASKSPRVLTVENERLDTSFRNASRVSFFRSKSPIQQEKSYRIPSDKSPINKARETKSPISTRIDLDPQQNKSSENFNNSNYNFANSHKRSSTLQYPQYTQYTQYTQESSNQSQMGVSPQRVMTEIRNYEMDTLKKLPGNAEGILMIAMKDIFSEIEKQQSKKRFFLRCSYLEIYNDQVYDLLNNQDRLTEVLTINEDANKEFYIKGATEEIVSSLDEITQKIKKGEMNRHYASTAMNHASSRSHTIFRLYVQSLPALDDNEQGHYMTESILNFVDLAGSEKVDIHDNLRYNRRESSSGSAVLNSSPLNIRVKENQHINKSLFFLTQVISLKSQGKQDLYIPYRNSPLTKILRSSLGGNSRTAIILCINPSVSQIEQTLGTLRFGLNAKKIENQVQANIICDANDETLKNLLKEYEKKIYDMTLERSKDKNTSEQLLKLIKNLQEQKKVLSDRLRNIKKSELFQTRLVDLPNSDIKHPKREHIHFKDVGILHVLASKEEQEKKYTYDFEGKYALHSLKTMKEQNKNLEAQVKELTQKLDEYDKEKNELFEALTDKDKQLSKKKYAMKHLADKVNEYHIKNDRLQQIVNLYQNRNSEGLKKLSMEMLCKLEANILSLLDSIKVQKALKLLCQALPKDSEENENYKLFKNFIYDATEKDNIMKANMGFGEDVNFGLDFFAPTSKHPTSSNKKNLLNIMQKDANIPVSVNCSVDPGNSSELMERTMQSPETRHLDSFQQYFNSVQSVKYEVVDNNGDISDRKLDKLRTSYNKIIELIKKDNLEGLFGLPQTPTLDPTFKYAEKDSSEANGKNEKHFSSPKQEKRGKDFSGDIAKNLSETNFMNAIGSAESNEIANSKMLSLLNNLEEKNNEKNHEKNNENKAVEKKKIIQKENIRTENINLELGFKKPVASTPSGNENGGPFRTKHAYVNL